MSKKKKYPVFENIEIIDIASDGRAIAYINDCVCFVRNVVPGDIVDIQIIKKRSSFMEGYAIAFQKHSEQRTQPLCSHFGVCGGCKWQMLPYNEQLKYKQKHVVNAIQRIGKVNIPEEGTILPANEIYYYRNKLEFSFSCNRWLLDEDMKIKSIPINTNALGFHIPKKFDKVLHLTHCYLQSELSDSIRLAIFNYANENSLEFYNLRTNEGFLRNLIIRTTTTGEIMVVVVFKNNEIAKITSLLNFISQKFPQITSLMYVINPKVNEIINDLPVVVFKGRDYIIETMNNLQFRIGVKSFYQTNSKQATILYSVVKNFADFIGNEIVYDLYTGTGTIACFISKNVKKVIGVDIIEDAIADAKVNAIQNAITNTKFFAGDMKMLLTEQFINDNGTPDVIITDPPRDGMHTDVIKIINNSGAKKIIYVSCNPSTQARDIALLNDNYELRKIQPVDMFPHTNHVENVALLIKRN